MDEVKEKENNSNADKDDTDKGKGTKTLEQPNSPGDEFELTAEMMVNDFDDERTLDEEEALEETEEQTTELSNLEKEKDMPIEDLLAMYGYSEGGDPDVSSQPSASEEVQSNHSDQLVIEQGNEEGNDQEEVVCSTEQDGGEEPSFDSEASEYPANQKRHLVPDDEADGEAEMKKKKIRTDPEPPANMENEDPESPTARSEILEDDGEKEQPSMLHELYRDDAMAIGSGSGARHLRSGSRQQSEEEDEEEDDGDYSPDEEDWKKTIMVGADYQAVIPDTLHKYDDAMPYENEDKQLWDPTDLSDKDIKDFLAAIQASQESSAEGINRIPKGSHVRDDEQALYLLLQCGLIPEEAIRRRTINNIPSSSSSSLWSEDECRNFESGLRQYGKDFHTIQQNRVRTRTVSELVQFYYLWKKTERHDVFAAKARLEKKKYILHPGTTDFMERFLDDQDSPATSPNIHSLLSGDPKRQNKTPPPSQQQLNNNTETIGTVTGRGPGLNNHDDVRQRPDKDGLNSMVSPPPTPKSTTLPAMNCTTPSVSGGGLAVGISEQKASTI